MRRGGLAGEARRLAPEVVDAFRRNGLINLAASISLLIVLALIPFVPFLSPIRLPAAGGGLAGRRGARDQRLPV